ncbi:SGNH hydrolase-type esterase domain-containing protein [Tricladium varicosporioides]|nr:SGNH hydrolase-type esterase domain-containing protein [Hymenoscyphus varicosporioides]
MVKLLNLGVVTLFASAVTAQTTKLRYMPFGDSITEIVCWRGLVWTQLQAAGYKNVDFVGSGTNQNSAGCKTTSYDKDNEGHSGFLAIDIANKKQLVDWLKKNPADLITMHLGTNDIVQQSKKTDDIIAAFSTLIQQMRDSNPKMKIIVAQIIPIGIGSSNTAIQALNKAIPAWAASKNTTQSPIWVVDQYTGFSTSDLRDGVHPNEAGDTKMAAKWMPALLNAIKVIEGGNVTKREVEFEG